MKNNKNYQTGSGALIQKKSLSGTLGHMSRTIALVGMFLEWIHFSPNIHATENMGITFRKATPVAITNEPYNQCSGKYPITVTKVTSDNVDNILIYRTQYEVAPGVSLIAKMQFDSQSINPNPCDIEKKMDKQVKEYTIKNSQKNFSK